PVIGIAISILGYIFLLSPILNNTISLPVFAKSIISVLCIAPAAYFLGMPFPNGLRVLSIKNQSLVPWAWGMNGALSVTGTVLTRLLSISFGFTFVLVFAIVIYVIAGFTYPYKKTEA
ncbi:MAG TPA: SAM-dependent methyltransferase, partial [Spirochaetota bacterium]|nr:SAM-dependent methyltransferase [Spirochaetota bacterium]